MAKQRVMIVGGGLAGLAAAMKLAELGIAVDLMSLTPVKRSHSVCAQGGINSVNDLTRQQGDNEWNHLDDTVYGGDFLQHQPPVKEMCEWGPKIIELMDRLGVTFNRTAEGFIDRRRFGGTLFKRTAFAGATTGQQLLYSLDEQVRRWETEGLVQKYEFWDFLGPDSRRRTASVAACVAQDLVSMEIRSFPGRRRDRRHRRMRPHLRPLDDVDGLHRQRREPLLCRPARRYGNAEFIQVHPTAVPGADKLRLMSESRPRRRGPRLGSAQAARCRAIRRAFPKPSATISSKSGIRSMATSYRAILPRAKFSTFA